VHNDIKLQMLDIIKIHFVALKKISLAYAQAITPAITI
jgi:hypothetical protein